MSPVNHPFAWLALGRTGLLVLLLSLCAPVGALTADERAADEALAALASRYSLIRAVNPTNEDSERERFLAACQRGEVYNPVFSYREPQEDLAQTIAALEAWRPPAGRWGALLDDRRREMLAECRMIEARGVDDLEFFRRAGELFGVPGEPDLELARRWVAVPDPPPSVVATPLEFTMVEQAFHAALRQAGLNDWRIAVSRKMPSHGATSGRSRRIFISPSHDWTEHDLKAVILQEVQVHARRAQGARRYPFAILQENGLPGAVSTELGLAPYLLEASDLLDPRLQRRIGAYVVAIDYAVKHSFYETFMRLRELGIRDDDAWMVTVRVKRGLERSESFGAYTQNHLYLSGYREVADYARVHGSVEPLLAYGKCSTRNVDLARELCALR